MTKAEHKEWRLKRVLVSEKVIYAEKGDLSLFSFRKKQNYLAERIRVMVQKIEQYLHTHIHRGENSFWDTLVS